MDKKVILNILKKYGLLILAYFQDKIWEKIKEEFNKAKKQFLNNLWDSIKEDLKADLNNTVKVINEFLKSSTYKEKEEAVINALMAKVKLPVFLKPFRGVLKKALKSKLKKLVEKALKKLNNIA